MHLDTYIHTYSTYIHTYIHTYMHTCIHTVRFQITFVMVNYFSASKTDLFQGLGHSLAAGLQHEIKMRLPVSAFSSLFSTAITVNKYTYFQQTRLKENEGENSKQYSFKGSESPLLLKSLE